MRAWRLTGRHAPFALERADVPEPVPGPAQLLVEPRAVGLCRSDLGFLSGTLAQNLGAVPITLGHEIAGVVRGVGAGVGDFAVGDRVAIRAGIETPGTATDGGFAELVVADAELAVAIPDGLAFDAAAVATDAGLTAYHAVVAEGAVGPGMQVGIVGLGGLGHLGCQIAVARGALVVGVDPSAEARAAAEACGAESVHADVAALHGRDLDAVIDFAGYGTTTAGAIRAVRSGATVVQVGLGVERAEVPLAALVSRRVRLVGSLTGTNDDLRAVLALIARGDIAPHTTSIAFDDIADGYERMRAGAVVGRLVAEGARRPAQAAMSSSMR